MANRKPIVLATAGTLEQIPDTDSLIVLSASFIDDIILVPAANGAFQIGTSGDARGDSAIDLQSVRAASTQVASGLESAILSGSDNTVSDDKSSIASGRLNVISKGAVNYSYNCIVSGYQNEIIGSACVICGGLLNYIGTANGVQYSSICGGYDCTISGSYDTICGGYQNSVGYSYNTICGGRENVIPNDSVGRNTIGGGYQNTITAAATNNGYNFIGGGRSHDLKGQYSGILSGYDHTLSVAAGIIGGVICGGYQNSLISNYAVVGGGRGHSCETDYSVIAGGRNNSIVSGYGTISGGYSNTIPVNCGDYNTITGGYSNTTVAGSTYNGSNVLGGYDCSIQGQYCVVAGGYSNDITLAAGALYSTICGGNSNDITASYGTIAGGHLNAVSASYASILGGYYGKADKYGQRTQASGRFAAAGDAQTSTFVLRCQTTNANATEMFLDGSTQRLTIPVNTSWLYTAKIIGRQTNGDYSVGVYHNEGAITRDAANASLINDTSIYSNEQDANWSVAITADTTNQSLKLAVTGVADNNINWVAKVELVEVTG